MPSRLTAVSIYSRIQVYVQVIVLLCVAQHRLIYNPTRAQVRNGDSTAVAHSLISLYTRTGHHALLTKVRLDTWPTTKEADGILQFLRHLCLRREDGERKRSTSSTRTVPYGRGYSRSCSTSQRCRDFGRRTTHHAVCGDNTDKVSLTSASSCFFPF